MTSRRRIVVTGLGAVSAFGAGAARLFAATLAGHTAVRSVPGPDGNPRWLAAAAPGDLIPAADGSLGGTDRHVQMARLAAQEALQGAGLDAMAQEKGDRAGIYWGTGAGSAGTVESGYDRIHSEPPKRLPPLTVLHSMQNAAIAQLAVDYGLRGPQLAVSQACASSAAAIGEALLALRHGRADMVLAGGSEASLVAGQMMAWEALRVMAKADGSPEGEACRPFDRQRRGLVLGEGAAAVVLETEESARARGAAIIAELCGYGNAGDASHFTKPDPAGQRRAMENALADAGIDAERVGYVNAHGTATAVGDVSELRALEAVFGPRSAQVAVSSTKGAHGHTLGAAGALEFVITALALARGELPPNANLREPEATSVDLIAGTGRARAVSVALSNSFAFGGSNVCLVLGAANRS